MFKFNFAVIVSLLATSALGLSNFDFVHAQATAATTKSTTPTSQEAIVNTGGVQASFMFTPLTNSSIGATIVVVAKKFPSPAPNAGFEYHIHVNPVGPNNDCMATGGHLDPTNVGMATKCDPETPEACQEGDLSGKHGSLMPGDFTKNSSLTYVDHQLRFSGNKTTIVGRSVVIHKGGARIACANILPVEEKEDVQNKEHQKKTEDSSNDYDIKLGLDLGGGPTVSRILQRRHVRRVR